MEDSVKPKGFCFGAFEANLETRELRKHGVLVRLPEQPFQILAMLLERPGEIVTREEIVAKLWGGETFVDFEQGVGAAINKLRRALGDSASRPRYVETLRHKGFRLLVPAVPLGTAIDEPAAKTRRDPRSALLLALALSTALALAGYLSLREWNRLKEARPVRSLAVLPFRLVNVQEGDQYLELGMTDALITSLGHLRNVAVRPTSAVRRYVAREVTTLDAGRELRVDAILEGTIQKVAGQIRVTVQLVRSSDGQPLWADKFDERFDGIFAAQDAVARRVANALVSHLSAEEREGVERRHTVSVEAFQSYQRGRYLWNLRTPDSLERATGFFQQAIDQDPNYALAQVGLADTYVLMNLYSGTQGRGTFVRAKEAVQRALVLDANLAEAHATAAYLMFNYDWDWQAAELEFRRAIALNPNYATSHQWYSEFLFYMARFPESVDEIRRAGELDPQSVVISLQQASPYLYNRQYEVAIEKIHEALRLDPDFLLGVYMYGLCLSGLGRFDEAINAFRKIEGTNLGLASLGYGYAKAGRLRDANRALERLLTMARKDMVSPYHVARVYANLGQPGEALRWLTLAVQARDERIVMLKVDPMLDPLRNDVGFRELLRSVRLLD